MRGSAANFQRGGIEDAALLDKIIFSVEVHHERSCRRRAPGDKQRFRKLGVPFSLRFSFCGNQRGIQIQQATQAGVGLKKSGGSEIQRAGAEFGVHGSQRSVFLIHRSRVAVELEFAAAGKIGGNGERKFCMRRNVGSHDGDVIVGVALGIVGVADNDGAVVEGKLLDGKIGGATLRGRRLSGGRLRSRRLAAVPPMEE